MYAGSGDLVARSSLVSLPFVVLWFSLASTPCLVSVFCFLGSALTGEVTYVVVLGCEPMCSIFVLSATLLLLFFHFDTVFIQAVPSFGKLLVAVHSPEGGRGGCSLSMLRPGDVL